MALIACRECGKEISDQAAACPHCGCPIMRRPVASDPLSASTQAAKKIAPKRSATKGWLVVIGIIILLAVMSRCGMQERPEAGEPAPDSPAPSAAKKNDETSTARAAQLSTEMRDETRNAGARLMAAKQLIQFHSGTTEATEAKGALPALEERVRIENIGKQWMYRKHDDSMSGNISRTAAVRSTNQFELDFPYKGAQRATLEVRRHPRWGNDVIFHIERGQILCSTYGDCRVRVRFDDGSPRTLKGNEPADNSSETVFIPGFSDFVSRLNKAKIVRIEVDLYQQGPIVAEFNVEGFDASKLK